MVARRTYKSGHSISPRPGDAEVFTEKDAQAVSKGDKGAAVTSPADRRRLSQVIAPSSHLQSTSSSHLRLDAFPLSPLLLLSRPQVFSKSTESAPSPAKEPAGGQADKGVAESSKPKTEGAAPAAESARVPAPGSEEPKAQKALPEGCLGAGDVGRRIKARGARGPYDPPPAAPFPPVTNISHQRPLTVIATALMTASRRSIGRARRPSLMGPSVNTIPSSGTTVSPHRRNRHFCPRSHRHSIAHTSLPVALSSLRDGCFGNGRCSCCLLALPTCAAHLGKPCAQPGARSLTKPLDFLVLPFPQYSRVRRRRRRVDLPQPHEVRVA